MEREDIIQEVRQAREAYARRFNYDLQAISRDLKKREGANGKKTVSFPPRRTKPTKPQTPQKQ